MLFNKFPVEFQLDSQDCGPASLKIISKFYGRYFSLQYLRDVCGITNQGVSMFDISTGAEKIGFRTLATQCGMDQFVNEISLPAIVYWKESHFIVAYKVTKNRVSVSDPMKGIIHYSYDEFKKGWYSKGEQSGSVLLLEPTPNFQQTDSDIAQQKNTLWSLLNYFSPYVSNFVLIGFIMLVVTLLQGVLPFISKAVIDVGIQTSDVKFINMILLGNIIILTSVMIFDILRDWILMHITSRVNIALISDYLIKLMKLPLNFFENKLLGDILQRAQDHERIRSFIMNNSLSMIFSILTFLMFGIILCFYSYVVFFIFLAGSFLYVSWVLVFLNIRKKLDWEYFDLISKNQSYWVETVSSIQDIKLFNYEKTRRWKWENIQARLYKVNKRVLNVTNAQNLGAQFVESIKNMSITFYCAIAVINGDITFGIMISTQFILGMLNGPLVQFINFIVSAQYAKISFLRMNEIRQLNDEEDTLTIGVGRTIPSDRTIQLTNVFFQYTSNAPFVLNGISFVIPENKVTAIVGGSGSGKSTLLKLLVRLYHQTYGTIKVGGVNIETIGLRAWREDCGVRYARWKDF